MASLEKKKGHENWPVTSEMKLLYGFSVGGLLVLEVGDCGVFENKPVFLVGSQSESFRSGLIQR